MCKAVAYIQGVSVAASVYSLVAVSLDRYVLLVQLFISVQRQCVDVAQFMYEKMFNICSTRT